MTVRLLICVFALTLANPNDQTQIERYADKVKQYKLNVPGAEPITIIETGHLEDPRDKWEEISVDFHNEFNIDDKKPRCFGPSCQEGFVEDEGPQGDIEESFEINTEKLRDYRDLSKDRLQAISDLAAKLKRNKYKDTDRVSLSDLEEESEQEESSEDDSRKVITSWNKLKVKQHKHPYEDRDGWITLEPVAWSTSKVSKWKPNKKIKPNHYWNEDEDHFSDEEKFSPPVTVSSGGSYTYTQKRPTITRPGYINNKLHVPVEYEVETPSKPSWNKPQQSMYTYPSTWSPDEGRRPHKPHCDSNDDDSHDDTVFYGLSDSVVTDSRPANFPYEYEALHQAASQKRPFKRPTQVVYAGSPELDNDRSSRPPHGDGQWVLLSTTKGYRNKKRQRSLNPDESERSDIPPIISHQSVGLTVLPVDDAHTNMTTSHGGLLEVEKSFKTVEESKRETDKKNDLATSSSQHRPVITKVIKRKVLANTAPDSSSVLAAVGAGMVPATMAMVVPMMLGRRRRRRNASKTPEVSLNNFFKY